MSATRASSAAAELPALICPSIPNDFPFTRAQWRAGWPIPVTAGNRSGRSRHHRQCARRAPLRHSGASALAPGFFGLSGVFTDPQFQVVVRALNQKKGVDLLSAPRVTTKSGQRAVIEIVREFRYPTQFDPPKIPDSTGATGVQGIVGRVNQQCHSLSHQRLLLISETRNTGVTLEVEPVVGPDGVTIDLNLVPQVVEFEGFINYGSPIQTFSTNALGITTAQVLTPNVINQPIFNSRKVTTSVSVWDGQTVVLGGLMREDVQKTEDRTPIIGDIPLVGRLFRQQQRATHQAAISSFL